MRKYNNVKALCFDDILLVPQQSGVKSRSDVNLSMTIGIRPEAQITLSTPIISAPMDTVTEWEMASHMSRLGGLGIIHRYMDEVEQVRQVKLVSEMGFVVGAAVAATGYYESHALELEEAGAKVICVDTANGHSDYALEAVKKLRAVLNPATHIMAGNVSTAEGYKMLLQVGADSVRVGIGGGAACTTRIVTGHGRPTLQSILDCFNDESVSNLGIIADGGIRNSGDMIKSFAAGASAVMLGSALAGHDEAPGDIIDGFKSFRGMASSEAQEAWRGYSAGSEGISTKVPYKGAVEDSLNNFRLGLGSGCSYSGSHSLSDLQEDSEYDTVSIASLNESKPHARGSA
jgi:IMP dehydrogenase